MGTLFENTEKRTTAPLRYDVVGSFLRPDALKEAREKFASGNITRYDTDRAGGFAPLREVSDD